MNQPVFNTQLDEPTSVTMHNLMNQPVFIAQLDEPTSDQVTQMLNFHFHPVIQPTHHTILTIMTSKSIANAQLSEAF